MGGHSHMTLIWGSCMPKAPQRCDKASIGVADMEPEWPSAEEARQACLCSKGHWTQEVFAATGLVGSGLWPGDEEERRASPGLAGESKPDSAWDVLSRLLAAASKSRADEATNVGDGWVGFASLAAS